jgi:hypothetical protein
MSEPGATPDKFPHAHIHTHLRAGASLVEAFWQSIDLPAEIICLGDPLLQTFADFPNVSLTAPAEGATVSGNVLIVATAAPTGGKTLESNLDLFIDGRRIAIGQAGETISATRTVGGFTVNTATLADGWHDVRVVAYNNDSVRTQNEAVRTIKVSNAGQSLALNGPATVNPDGNATFTVTPVGLGDLTSLTLQANGRTLATLPTSGGSANISGSLAPLANTWSVYAVGTRSNGQQIWSAPFTTTVDWPAQPAATNVALGGAQANVRYFNSTNGTGFNWDTSTPNVTTTFTGNDTTGSQDWVAQTTGGLSITPTNIPGITFNSTTVATLKPGYEVKCWFYAPTDDFYEVGVWNQAWTNSGTASVAIDGVTLPQYDYVFGPRRLSPGWHELRMRATLTNNNWTSTQVRLRGGSSQDFSLIIPSVSASMGTGSPATTPQILSITPSTSPVTTTNVTLTANATIGGGTPAERAGLTYHWSQLSGPKPVTFSVTGAAGQPVTTVTFTQTGNYVFGLRVAGATDSAHTTIPVTVQAGAPTMVLSSNGYTDWLRGLPLNVSAYSKDQFGSRIAITPTVPGQPTVNWTSTDPNGSFQNISANGETAQFVSLSALTANATCTLTATGTNGRTGSATTPNLTIATNASPNALFSIAQSGNTTAITFTSSFRTVTLDSPIALLTYHWSVLSTPPGGTLALGADGGTKISGIASAPGYYTVRLDVTDHAGATASQTQTFHVDGAGAVTTQAVLYNQTLHVGQSVVYQLSFPHGDQTFQWQTSADGGASWQNLAGTTSVFRPTIYPTLNYGPVTTADNGRQFRLNIARSGSVLTGVPTTLTVVNPVGGTLRIGEVLSTGEEYRDIPENAGSATFTIRRVGGSSGAASARWTLSPLSATRGADYLALNGSYSGTLTWADGDSSDRLITVPIVNDALAEDTEEFQFNISSATGASIGPVGSTNEPIRCYILDDDNAGQAEFRADTATVTESAGSITLPVQRSNSSAGNLTVNYTTQSQTAAEGQDFTAVSGTLTWTNGDTADKQIVVPILSDNLVEGDETFTVTLTAPDTTPSSLGWNYACTFTIKDAPYQQWQKAWWPSAIPALPLFFDYETALRSLSPLFEFRFSETSGTAVVGVDADGATVATGTLGKNGTSGNYTLAQAGPRPSLWPGLESGNNALSFTTGTAVTATPPRYTAGASVNCGAANGLGSMLGSGFTISMFVKTSVIDREMTLVGGKRLDASPTTFFVSLNRASNNATACVPHAVRIYISPQGVNYKQLDFSIPMQNLPTGSICDGQWHHLAITVPELPSFGTTDYTRFYFDDVEVNTFDVRGTNDCNIVATFSDFSDTGFRIGSDGSATPISFFNGALDEVAFIPRVLTATEIANLCAAQPPTTPPAYMAAAANPTGDGVPNLMKYAFGLNPQTAYTGPLTDTEIVDGRLSLIFPRQRDATDITYRVQASSDLANWTNIWNSATAPYPGGLNPSVLLSVPDTEVIGAPGINKRFLRVQVTQP